MVIKGIKIPHLKNTRNCQTVDLPQPKTVSIPLSQTMGGVCEPVVSKGDAVKAGQIIGDCEAFMSVPVHSSVSGIVSSIDDHLLANGRVCKKITIENDGKETLFEKIAPPKFSTKDSFVQAVRESGCCGMGGAGFPTHIKFAYKDDTSPIDTIVINAAECEPYITSDYREMIEHPDDVVGGTKALLSYLNIRKACICIENNKPEAIKLLDEMTSDTPFIDIVSLSCSYPQGAEKVVTYNSTGRLIKEGELPSQRGVIVLNVSTVAFLNRFFKTGIPMINKRITVDGDTVRKPCNLNVPIGTAALDLLKYAECDFESTDKILFGGLMMGQSIYDAGAPIIKTTNAVLALKKAKVQKQTSCIRCGRCINACPMGLAPTEIEKAFLKKDSDALKSLKVNLCMNCGSCSYVCPAKRHLAEANQLAKALITPKK